TYPQAGFGVNGGQLSLSKIGNVKIKLHRSLQGEVKTLTLKNENGKWYACFSCILDSEPLPENHDAIGIDVGLESFAVTSDAEMVDHPRWFRAAQKELRRKQRHASRCTKRSSGWKRACRTVAKLHRHVFQQRNDFQHKLSREFVNNYGIIAVEDLNIQGLASGRLAKSVHDAAWSGFIRKLSYKAESAGRWLVKVNARGTSQQCPCGRAVPKQLWDRKHHCSACGLETIRDHASALEILRRGLSLSLSHRAEACAWRSADLGTVITLGDLAQAASFSKHTPQLVDTLQIRNVVGIAGDSEGDLARRSAAPIPNRDSLVVAKHQRV